MTVSHPDQRDFIKAGTQIESVPLILQPHTAQRALIDGYTHVQFTPVRPRQGSLYYLNVDQGNSDMLVNLGHLLLRDSSFKPAKGDHSDMVNSLFRGAAPSALYLLLEHQSSERVDLIVTKVHAAIEHHRKIHIAFEYEYTPRKNGRTKKLIKYFELSQHDTQNNWDILETTLMAEHSERYSQKPLQHGVKTETNTGKKIPKAPTGNMVHPDIDE